MRPDPEAEPGPGPGVDDETCPHCGAVLDVQRALAQDAPLLTKRRRRPPA